jgi:hypothetical protein
LEQEDMALIYNYLRELVLANLNNSQSQPSHASRFLVDDKTQNKISRMTATSSNNTVENESFFEFQKVYLDRPKQSTYYLIPYNLSKLTFFIFIRADQSFKLSLVKEIDQILAPHMIEFVHEIAEQQSKRNLVVAEVKEIKYIYFNRFNLAQKSTINSSKDTPKYIMNLISQLSKDLES